MKYTFIIFLSITTFSKAQKRVGINTEKPHGIFHIDSKKNTPETVATLSQLSDDFIVKETTGDIGVGTNAPKVKLDIRNNSVNNALGIGDTNLSAIEAEKGAIRYNGTSLQYSNGTHWVNLLTESPEKTVVIATKTNNDTYAYEPGGHSCTNCNVAGAPHRTSAYLTNWTQKYNSTTDGGSFNASTGVFTANRAGTFTATFTFALADGMIRARNGSANPLDTNQIEAIWRVYNANNIEMNSVKCANTFPSDSRQNSGDSGNAKAGSNCTAIFYLQAGQMIRPALWIDLNPGGPKLFDLTLSGSNSIYNNLTIVEN